MKKTIFLLSSFIVCLFFLIACQSTGTPVHLLKSLLPTHHYGNNADTAQKQSTLHEFITSKLSGEYGVYTNLLETDQSQQNATGHEIVSESAGLSLRYDALTKQKATFQADWERTKQTFDLQKEFSYRYSPLQQKRYTLNAAVDDLRIIRSLYEAGVVFSDSQYTKEAETYANRFYKNNVKNNYVYDFYDETYNQTNTFITLCYIDLKTLQLLPIAPKQQQQLMTNMQNIIQKGYLSDSFPFYETRYNYDTKNYSSENINTVESLMTILSLAEMGQQNPASIRYIKEQVKNGTLYGQYTKEGTPTNQIQSTAIYAITAIIGSQIGDKSLYTDSINRMNNFQIQDQNSILFGGFGDASGQAYSFDNLMALLAYTY